MNTALGIYACLKEKPYSKTMFVNNAVFSAFVIYGSLVNGRVYKSGAMAFYIYAAYLGAVIYLAVFFVVFILDFFRRLKELEGEKKEYERITLLRGIGHDMKLPLTVIKMNNQMLMKYRLEGEELKECAKMSTEAALELEKMADNISSYINMEVLVSNDYVTSFRECFDKTVRHYSALSSVSGYDFSASWDGEDAALPIKSLQIERIFYNLLDNAMKYNKTGGNVSLSCRVEHKKAIILVQDSGIGMEKDQLDKIFMPFYRADESRTVDGLGLGLSVVKGIIENLKGEIKAESKTGIGTKITVILPLH